MKRSSCCVHRPHPHRACLSEGASGLIAIATAAKQVIFDRMDVVVPAVARTTARSCTAAIISALTQIGTT